MTMRLSDLAELASPARVRLLGGVLSLLALLVLAALIGPAGWEGVVGAIAGASVGWIIAAVLLALLVEVIKTVRWQVLLGPRPGILPSLLAILLTGRLLNVLAPLRAGDVWRLAAVTRMLGRPTVAVAASLVAEKLCDGVALGTASAIWVWAGGPGVQWLLWLGVPVAAGILLAPWLTRRHAASPRLRGWTRELSYLRDWRRLGGAAALTVVSQGLGLCVNLLVLLALGLPVSPIAGLSMLIGGYAAGLVPSGPIQLGVFELAVAGPLTTVGFAPPSATAAALTLHAVLLLMVALGGLLAMPLSVWEQRLVRRVGTESPAEVKWRGKSSSS